MSQTISLMRAFHIRTHLAVVLLCTCAVAWPTRRALAEVAPPAQVQPVAPTENRPASAHEVRQAQRLRLRLVQQEMELDPEYGTYRWSRIGSVALFGVAILTGAAAAYCGGSGLLRGASLYGSSDAARARQDREYDFLFAGVFGGLALMCLISGFVLRSDRDAQSEVLRQRAESRLSVSAMVPYVTEQGAVWRWPEHSKSSRVRIARHWVLRGLWVQGAPFMVSSGVLSVRRWPPPVCAGPCTTAPVSRRAMS